MRCAILFLIDRIIAWPLLRLWLRYSRDSWNRLPIPHDSPQVHAPGSYADRILIAGDGVATGRGVLTHDLGLPGHLARAVSARTGRAADVDIAVSEDSTAASCRDELAGLELSRFDAILLSVGFIEALSFTPVTSWSRALTTLLDLVETQAAPSTRAYLLSIPEFGPRRQLPGYLARAVDRRVRLLNDATLSALAERADTRLIVVGHTDALERSGARTYEVWAESVAPQVAAHLAPHGHEKPHPRDEVLHESDRQASVDRFSALGHDGDVVLDRLTSRAREVFDTSIAAITLIDGDRQRAVSTAGELEAEIPRGESFCDTTIRRAEPFAVEDASRDFRYSHFRSVLTGPRVRFYAGYPIESTDGQRVGALCIIDPKARDFTSDDSALLRLMALEAQKRLWELDQEATD